MVSYQQWTLIAAVRPLLSQTLAITYALYILAYPPRHRHLAFLLLCVPISFAFTHHLSLTPWYSLNDTFGRMLYIWLAYMSYAFLIVRVSPNAEEGDGWQEKLKWAGKVLYTRHLGEYYTPPCPQQGSEKEKERKKPGPSETESTAIKGRREPPHHLTCLHFCLHHLFKATLFLALNHTYDTFLTPPTLYPPPSFIRRLPCSLSANELKLRAMMTYDVCFADMLYFSSIYSVFAILWVGIFRFDAASEWSLSLFGPLREVYSVRRYWGAYWHDFINASFTAHGKAVTRGWLGMRKGPGRRVVENTVVFGVSGLMHALVRYVQTEGTGEIWTVAMWYGVQMFPIVVEGVVQYLWLDSSLRKRLLVVFGESMLTRVDRAVGYAWTFCWMSWSVPKYLLTRHAWELENLRRKYPELFAGRRERMEINLGGLQ